MNPAQRPSPGARLGRDRFELLSELGEGGMSLVYRARDHATGREVALKVLQPRYVGRPEREQRLINEASYLRQLQGSPHIVELIASGRFEDRDWPWLATEVLPGRTLNWLFVQGRLSVDTIVDIGRQVAHCLVACHERGIVNRDVTPTNVFVVDEDPCEIKLFDFSHAARLDAGTLKAGMPGRLTGTFDIPGTVGYMSPEQTGQAPPTPTMDVFGFGALLFEMITRDAPYSEFGDREGFIRAQREARVEPLRLHAWAYTMPDALGALIGACTQRSAQDRPSMTEVLDRLEQLGAGTLPEPPPPEDTTQRLDLAVVSELQAGARAQLAPPSAGLKTSTTAANLFGSWEREDSAASVPKSERLEPATPPTRAGHELAFARPPEQRPPDSPLPPPADMAARGEPEEADAERSDAESDLHFTVIFAMLQSCADAENAATLGADPDKRGFSLSTAQVFGLIMSGLTLVIVLAMVVWGAQHPNPLFVPELPLHTQRSGGAEGEDGGTPLAVAGDAGPSLEAIAEVALPDLPGQRDPEPEVDGPEPRPPGSTGDPGEPDRSEPKLGSGSGGSPDTPSPPPTADPPASHPANNPATGAKAAAKRREWAHVLEYIEQPGWASSKERLQFEVTAHSNLSQWAKCIAAGEGSHDPQVQAAVALCEDSL